MSKRSEALQNGSNREPNRWRYFAQDTVGGTVESHSAADGRQVGVIVHHVAACIPSRSSSRQSSHVGIPSRGDVGGWWPTSREARARITRSPARRKRSKLLRRNSRAPPTRCELSRTKSSFARRPSPLNADAPLTAQFSSKTTHCAHAGTIWQK